MSVTTVAGSFITVNTIDSNHYVDGSIDFAHMAANSIDSAQYVDGSIDTVHIDDLQITGAKIAANTITGDKIALGSDAAGDIMYYNGTDWIRVGVGTDGQVLTVNNAENAPGWEAASGGSITALSGNAENRIPTFGSTTTVLDGDADLTFNGNILSIGAPANTTNTTVGLIIDQKATNDDLILQLRSATDVAHGMTSLATADTYGSFGKSAGNAGGLSIRGFVDSNIAAPGLTLYGTLDGAFDVATPDTSSMGAIELRGSVRSGTSDTAGADGGNVFVVRNRSTTRMIVRGNGEMLTSENASFPSVTKGTAKAWGMVRTATDDVTISYNIDSSGTNVGTGLTTITFTTDMQNANYACVGATNNGVLCFNSKATTGVRVDSRDYSGNGADSGECYIAFFGEAT
jgi:hypothetical protein